ncbi:MAG: DUF1080 domain-containing protein [Candidatus Brocadiae bacterium]|nr:DUF1080 domain-containing protein [Candidatus Brocadiia bacterium]
MKRCAAILSAMVLAAGCYAEAPKPDADGWYTLFDGKSLDGWKASEKAASFSVRDGMLCVEDGRSHLFYMGPACDHNFTNFELKLDVMTTPGANSGVFFHTQWQERGWPRLGFEAQVNTTHRDRVKTGSIYHVRDVLDKAPSKDNVWFAYTLRVRGKRVVVEVDGKVVNDYTEPAAVQGARKLSSGTVAIQGHDPRSKVYYKNIKIKPLPD